jgi:Fe-Mn family superoxide dismutase
MESTKSNEVDSDRREFLKVSAIGAAATAAVLTGLVNPVHAVETPDMPDFPPLPYAENALEPSISARTLQVHYGNHYRKYMNEVFARVKGTEFQDKPLETIIKGTVNEINMRQTLHLMALMSWNHDFYWKSMKPNGGGEMPSKLKKAVIGGFGSVEAFKKQFKEAAMTLGSGWAWLVSDNGKLAVNYTAYGDTPILTNKVPLLTIDVWEHAYYLDYEDKKGQYVDAFLEKLANWEFAESRMPAEEKSPKASK